MHISIFNMLILSSFGYNFFDNSIKEVGQSPTLAIKFLEKIAGNMHYYYLLIKTRPVTPSPIVLSIEPDDLYTTQLNENPKL